MKKFFCYFIILTMLVFGCLHVMASDGKVEVSFCVGDDTLIINGTPVKVEKPYVVGSGVTLVPVRVITEAFDAKVDWIKETKTVKLTYPDVDIVIQIGNPVAEVNGRAETLLAAPELTDSGYTMVPLRFISENFGAEVSYDKDTKRITVTKEKTADSEVSIEGSVNSKYIGDDFFDWSMENPLNMSMKDRSFDGMETVFSDGENAISVEIFLYDQEEYDFDSDFNKQKMSVSDYTLVKSEKDSSDNNCKWMQIAFKDKEYYYDYQQFITPKYIYVVMGSFSNEKVKTRDEYIRLVSTFKCSYEDTDTYNLSNIKDGFRKFESQDLKISFNVPENFRMSTSKNAQNVFEFYEIEKGVSSLIVSIYSKSEVESAEILAKSDYEHNKKTLNEDITKFSDDVFEMQYENLTAFEYEYELKTDSQNYRAVDVFFEIGDYVYNVSVHVELPYDEFDNYVNEIVNSVKAETLSADEIGVFMRNIPTATGTIKAKMGKVTITLPNIYMKLLADDNSMSYIGPVNGVYVMCSRIPSNGMTTTEFNKAMKESERALESEGATILKTLYDVKIDNKKFYAFSARVTNEEGVAYLEEYACSYNNYIYLFTISCSEISYSQSTRNEIIDIINSIDFE